MANQRDGSDEPVVIDIHLRLEVVGVPREQIRLNVSGPVAAESAANSNEPSAPEASVPEPLPPPSPPIAKESHSKAKTHVDPARMLVISRKKNEGIVINNDITIVVVEIRGDKVRLGIESPKEVPVHRGEVYDAITRHDSERASGSIFG